MSDHDQQEAIASADHERRARIEHDPVEEALIQQAAADSLRQLREHGSSGARFVKSGGDVFMVIVRYDRKGLVDVTQVSRDRLAELVSKVSHGYNLINSEAREVLEHFGAAVETRKRCDACGGKGSTCMDDKYLGRTICLECGACDGAGYKVRK